MKRKAKSLHILHVYKSIRKEPVPPTKVQSSKKVYKRSSEKKEVQKWEDES